jgi:hypothetical protein
MEGTQVLGVTGHAQHGKDTTAETAADRGYKRYAFADNVRRAVWALNPIVLIDANDTTVEEYDETVQAVLRSPQDVLYFDADGAFVRVQALVRALGGVDGDNVGAGPGWDAAKQLPEVRRLLQYMGTESVRDIVDEEAWVMALERQLREEAPARAIITDVRFPNEAAAVKRWGGKMLRVVRVLKDSGEMFVKEGLDLNHGSEKHVATLPVDFEVVADNVSTLDSEVEGVLDTLDDDEEKASWCDCD